MSKADKVIWLWLNGNSSKELRIAGTGLRLVGNQELWSWIFARSACACVGVHVCAHVRANRTLFAVRLRSQAYRLAGYAKAQCSGLALADLNDVLQADKSAQPPRKGKHAL